MKTTALIIGLISFLTPLKSQMTVNEDISSKVTTSSELSRYEQLIMKAEEFEAMENFKKAFEYYDMAIEAQPEIAVAYDKKAVALLKINKYQRAAKYILRCLEIDPFYSEAYIHLGIIHHFYENYELAIESYNKAIRIDPESGKAYFNRSLSLLEIDDVESAYEDLQFALKLNYYKAEDVIWNYCTDVMLKKTQFN